MKKLLVIGGVLTAVLSAKKRRQAGARADSAKLWSEAVKQPSSS